MRDRLKALLSSASGNIAISAALALPIMLGAMAMGIDYGYLTLQQRTLQSTADLAAIAAASNINAPEQAALAYFQLNNQNIVVKTASGLLTPTGLKAFDPTTVYTTYSGYAEISKARYLPDPSLPAASRVQINGTPADAIRLTVHQKSQLMFGASITDPPMLGATGTAAVDKVASFSIGTRLASLDGGIVNSLLGGLLGTTISLQAMDYQSLVNAQIDVLKTLDVLAINLGLTAGTYQDLLATDITFGQLVTAITKTPGNTSSVSTILNTLFKAVDKTKVTLKLQDVLSLGPIGKQLVGQSQGLTFNASIMQLISAAATAHQGGNQLNIDLGTPLLGLGSATLTVAIGAPPAETPTAAVGSPGMTIRTAQTRLALTVNIDGLAALLGLQLKVPLYIDVAYAEAQLAAITCSGTGKNNATVDVDAIPGVVELAIGNVDTSAFSNFGKTPRVTQTDIVSSLLVDVVAMADAKATNSKISRLTFSPSDITSGKVRTVSTQDTLTTLTQSLLSSLTLQVRVLSLPLVLPGAITSAVASTLQVATVPLDTLIYNLLLTLGVRVGEADVRVGGVVCRNPVLVQ